MVACIPLLEVVFEAYRTLNGATLVKNGYCGAESCDPERIVRVMLDLTIQSKRPINHPLQGLRVLFCTTEQWKVAYK